MLYCPPSPSVLWTSSSRRPQEGSSPSSPGPGLHRGSTWQLKMEVCSLRQSWLRTLEADLRPMNLWLATAKRRAQESGPIGLTEKNYCSILWTRSLFVIFHLFLEYRGLSCLLPSSPWWWWWWNMIIREWLEILLRTFQDIILCSKVKQSSKMSIKCWAVAD